MGKIGLSPGEKNIMKRALLFIAIILNVSTLQGNSTELILGDFSGSGMFLQEYCSLLMQESIDGLPEDFELTIRTIDNLNPLEVNAVSAVATDRKLRPDNSQFKHLIYARLPILVLVKADCPADNLSLDELRRIFEGKVTNLQRLNKADFPLTPISCAADSPAVKTFRHLINDNEKSPFEFIPGMLQYRNTNAAKALLQAIPGGIVLGSWQLAELVKNKKSTYKLLSINGISPSADNINSGKYPLTANHILLWSSSNPPSRLNVLIKFLHSSALRSGHLIPAPEAENF